MTRTKRLLPVLFAICLMFSGCSSQPEKKSAEAERKASEPAAPAKPEQTFKVKFETSKGPFVVEVHPAWAPLGAERFEQLVKDGFFDNSYFYRVVPNFVAQFGLAADPKKTKKWDKAFKDDPVLRTNKVGSISFATAGPNTRTTQVFINLRSNQMLDDQGFAPFAEVVEGMEVVEKLYGGYGDESYDQDKIMQRGTPYLKSAFPKLDYIKKAAIM